MIVKFLKFFYKSKVSLFSIDLNCMQQLTFSQLQTFYFHIMKTREDSRQLKKEPFGSITFFTDPSLYENFKVLSLSLLYYFIIFFINKKFSLMGLPTKNYEQRTHVILWIFQWWNPVNLGSGRAIKKFRVSENYASQESCGEIRNRQRNITKY